MVSDRVSCFRQKSGYELRMSDWSSDVCSSDLLMIAQLDRIDRCRIAGIAGKGIGEAPFQRFEHRIARIGRHRRAAAQVHDLAQVVEAMGMVGMLVRPEDRKSTRLNSSH